MVKNYKRDLVEFLKELANEPNDLPVAKQIELTKAIALLERNDPITKKPHIKINDEQALREFVFANVFCGRLPELMEDAKKLNMLEEFMHRAGIMHHPSPKPNRTRK